ncbi:MAG: hypothetical protein HY960_12775 [Ignavibacteriae bacterium]|nr:hypothetical protein [Ignavibacteriota bacterium]
MGNFLPRAESLFLQWLENFITKIATYAATFGLSGSQVDQFTTDRDSVKSNLADVDSLKKTLQSKVKTKDEVVATARKHALDLAVILKRHTSYTEAIGEDLGIVAPDDSGQGSLDTAKPRFWATVLVEMVLLDWLKEKSDGQVFYSKRGTETEYKKLDRDFRSPMEDKRPNLVPGVPETRWYKSRFLKDDKEVGLWSDEVSVIVNI